ncbi:Filamin-C [Takifugu flavidus]|uniref:Filamin-C n=1 Tax=Takifugu flavidus TaxID=433684 RepID=A0A5C6N696_9TELE|nr:Filamin-C [Takifugu flavidus]
MPATEKDLAEDAPWKKIQQNTFTRWINEHLKCVNKRIVDLQLDLGDGLRLIALLEVLSHKKMYRKYHPRPNFGQMKLENVSVALEFLDKENIKLVSIDSAASILLKTHNQNTDDLLRSLHTRTGSSNLVERVHPGSFNLKWGLSRGL